MPPAQMRRQHDTIANAILKQNYQQISQHKLGTQGTHAETVTHNRHRVNSDTSQEQTCKQNLVLLTPESREIYLAIRRARGSRPAKRLRLEGAKPLNLTIATHFQLFFQGPRALKRESKCSQNGASGRPKSQKLKKTGHTKKH